MRAERCEPLEAVSWLAASAVKIEGDGNGGFDFDRLSLKKKRFVPPLLHCVDGSRGQHGMAAHQLQVLNGSGFVDDGGQHHYPLDASLPRQRWVGRFNLAQKKP